MFRRRIDTIEGFNAFLSEQQKLEEGDEATLTLVLFDHEYLVVHEDAPVGEVPLLTEETYSPRGTTALYDAVGRTLMAMDTGGGRGRFADISPEEIQNVVVIITDGCDNSSKELSREDARKLLEERQAQGWQAVFLGSELTAEAQGQNLGVARANVRRFTPDSVGTRSVYEDLGRGLVSSRMSVVSDASAGYFVSDAVGDARRATEGDDPPPAEE